MQREVGLIVDAVTGIADFEELEFIKPSVVLRGLKGRFLRGIARKRDGAVLILDMDNILGSDEKIAVEGQPKSGGEKDGRP